MIQFGIQPSAIDNGTTRAAPSTVNCLDEPLNSNAISTSSQNLASLCRGRLSRMTTCSATLPANGG